MELEGQAAQSAAAAKLYKAAGVLPFSRPSHGDAMVLLGGEARGMYVKKKNVLLYDIPFFFSQHKLLVGRVRFPHQ
jgi:hypothetical protein